jgi:hypothetical protein
LARKLLHLLDLKWGQGSTKFIEDVLKSGPFGGKETKMEEQSTSPENENKESFFSVLKNSGKKLKEKMGNTYRTVAEKSARAKESMSEKSGKIDAENSTLQEAMEKIEKEIFAGTKILEDLDEKFVGSARKLRDQTARRTAKTIYERWKNEIEKEEVKPIIEMDYDDV